MLSVEEAQKRLVWGITPLQGEIIPLEQAAGRVLAQDVFASIDLPPFPNSAMDGFAVRSIDVSSADPAAPVQLRVIGDIPAGRLSTEAIREMQAMRIMTGAPLPAGADCVVPVEDTDFNQRQPGSPLPEQVNIYQAGPAGSNIRPKAKDIRAGELILPVGKRLRPQEIGLLGMIGISQANVFRQPLVALLSTGDELVPANQPLPPGKIFDSNTQMLASQVHFGGGKSLILGIANDRADSIRSCLEQAVEAQVDLIVSSAGVSVGAFDFVRVVVEQDGVLDFWRVNVRPGKPFAFGNYKNIPFFGLPGNPVSAYVTFELFVRPVIAKMNGIEVIRRKIIARLTEPITSDGRESYLRAVVSDTGSSWEASLTGDQGSGNLRSLVLANALLKIPSAVKSLPIGAECECWLLDG